MSLPACVSNRIGPCYWSNQSRGTDQPENMEDMSSQKKIKDLSYEMKQKQPVFSLLYDTSERAHLDSLQVIVQFEITAYKIKYQVLGK